MTSTRRQVLGSWAVGAVGSSCRRMRMSFAQAGVQSGQPLPPLLMESYPDQMTVEAARLYTRELAEIGMQIDHKPLAFGQILGKVYGRKELVTAMMGFGSPEERFDPDFYLRAMFQHRRHLQRASLQQSGIRPARQGAAGRNRSDEAAGVDRPGAAHSRGRPAILARLLASRHQSGEQEALQELQAVKGAWPRTVSRRPLPRTRARGQRQGGECRDDFPDEFRASLHRTVGQRARLSALHLRHVPAL